MSQPDTGEQALEIVDTLVRSGAMDVIVMDSVAALVPRAEIEGEMGDSHVGLQARLMCQALRKLTGNVNRSNTILVFINQLREKIGVMFGSPETTPGGRALKFYSSVRLDIRRIDSLKDGAEIVGSRVRVKVIKNKVAAPFRKAESDIQYQTGISKREPPHVAIEDGIVRKSGAWFIYGDDQLGQGRENSKTFLAENPDIVAEIELKIKEKLGLIALRRCFHRRHRQPTEEEDPRRRRFLSRRSRCPVSQDLVRPPAPAGGRPGKWTPSRKRWSSPGSSWPGGPAPNKR